MAADWCELAASGNSSRSHLERWELAADTVVADAEPCNDGGMGREAQSCDCDVGSVTVDAEADPCGGRSEGNVGSVVSCSESESRCDLLESESESLTVVAAHPSKKAVIVAACLRWPPLVGCGCVQIEASLTAAAGLV